MNIKWNIRTDITSYNWISWDNMNRGKKKNTNAKEMKTVDTHMPAWKTKHSDCSIKHQAWEHINALVHLWMCTLKKIIII